MQEYEIILENKGRLDSAQTSLQNHLPDEHSKRFETNQQSFSKWEVVSSSSNYNKKDITKELMELELLTIPPSSPQFSQGLHL